MVFVAYAAPGDRVEVSIRERRPDYLRADVARVVAPGPARVVPGCAWFPRCGGCQWQHVAPAAQRDAKAAVVAEQLARVAGVRDVEVLPTLASPLDWEYRARISLVAEGRRLGYHAAGSHRLIEIDACPIADPVLGAHLAAARAWLAALRIAVSRVTIAVAPGGVVLAAVARSAAGDRDRDATERFLVATPTVRGAIIAGGGTRMAAGDPNVGVQLEPGLVLEAPADVFTQVNPAANQLLIASVLAIGGFVAGDRVLDLYAGAGNFTLPIARRGAAVLGVERNALAVDTARANAGRLGFAHARFECAEVAAALAALGPGTFDRVVLDPPRAGAADAIAALAALRAPRMLYVSCDPATLARDVRALGAHGYAVRRVQPVDLFPQTYHIESVAELVLT